MKLRWSVAVLLCSTLASPLLAQQVQVGTPLVGVQDSFFEHYGVGWSYQSNRPGGSTFFSFGGPTSALPPFGGFDPSSGARLGFRSGGFSFNFHAAQGSSRSISSATPSLTLSNGVPGFIQSGSVRPFVTGLIPVIGAGAPGPVLVSPLEDRLRRLATEPPPAEIRETEVEEQAEMEEAPLVLGAQRSGSAQSAAVPGRASSARRGDISLAEIRRTRAREDEARQRELPEWIEQAEAAERQQRFGAARIRYRRAAQRAHGDLKLRLLAKLAELKEK